MTVFECVQTVSGMYIFIIEHLIYVSRLKATLFCESLIVLFHDETLEKCPDGWMKHYMYMYHSPLSSKQLKI